MCSFLTFFIHSSPFLSVNDMSNICALLGSDSGLFYVERLGKKKSFLLNLIIAQSKVLKFSYLLLRNSSRNMEGLQRCQRMQTFEGKCISTEETGEFVVGVKEAFFNVFLLYLCLLAARQKAETQGGKNETDLCCTQTQ